jgi:methyl-accepting chemotaxis protein
MSSQAEQLQHTMAFFKLAATQAVPAATIVVPHAAAARKPAAPRARRAPVGGGAGALPALNGVDESSFTRY